MHDVCVALGLLAAVGVDRPDRSFGSMLLVEDFRIDLGVVAALLTIIGYSLNDTIVILDRIRENRGKLPIPTPEIVNKSIIVGLVVGTYSSMAIAAPLVVRHTKPSTVHDLATEPVGGEPPTKGKAAASV